jgi:hypothetical protein
MKRGKHYKHFPYTPYVVLGDMQTTTSRHDARCKQAYGCHIQTPHIFLMDFHIKYFLFRVTVEKIRKIQDLHICRNFRKQRKKNARAESAPDLRRRIVAIAHQRRMRSELLGRGPSMRDLCQKKEKRLGLIPNHRDRTRDLSIEDKGTNRSG